jgi:hypothetical protein
MREHTYLPAMMSFVTNHVAQHFWANRPSGRPAVPAKLLDSAITAESFCEHLRAAGGALCQCRTSLLLAAVRAVQLGWDFQMWSGKPDPLGANIVQVREDRRNVSGLAGWFGFPGLRVKILDKHLVDALIGCENPHSGSAKFSVNLATTRGHAPQLLDL